MLEPFQNIRNLILYDVRPTIAAAKEAIIGYGVNGQSIVKNFYGRLLQKIREYVPQLEVPPSVESLVHRFMNKTVLLIMEYKDSDDITMIELLPNVMDLVGKISREIENQDGLRQDIEALIKGQIDSIKSTDDSNVMKVLATVFGENILTATPELPDEVQEGLTLTLSEEEKHTAEQERIAAENSVVNRLKRGMLDGRLEDTVLEILHEHPIVLNMVRSKFPDLEILKRQVRPKSREDRLKALLKKKREQRLKH
jgi:hypothetical protein